MEVAALISLLISLALVLVGVVAAVISTLVPVVLVFFVVRKLRSSGGVVIAVPTTAMVATPATHAEPEPVWIKRSTCRACGSAKVQRTLSAYVYCDFCGLLIDWDFQAALADTRSKLPGSTYEALIRQLQPALTQAKAAGDRAGYEALQVKIYTAYARACPAALPPRIKDPIFAERFVAWSARSQTLQDLDPTTTATLATQQAAVDALVWDRSRMMAPRIELHTFWPLMEAVVSHQRAVLSMLEQAGLLAEHPDHPTAEIFQRIGLSAMVQGWMSYMPADATEKLLAMSGLDGEYVEVSPLVLRAGACPHCSAPIEAAESATRVLCYSCGQMVGAGSGGLECHGCGGQVEVPADTNLFGCPHCAAELRMMRWPTIAV